MGSYLSEPVTEKISTDESSNTLICGASSMQGWRHTQEDAHNCILDYDTHSSYFAVYDGHGGHEVALYCSKNLPQFLKSTEAYKSGDMKKALEEAFLDFDSTITSPEVIEKLKKLTQDRPDDEESDDDDTVIENCTSNISDSVFENVNSVLTNNLNESPSKENNATSEDVDSVVDSSTKNEAHNLKTDKSDNVSNTTKIYDLEEVQTESLISEVKVESPDSSLNKNKKCTVSNNNNKKLNDALNKHTEILSLHKDNTCSYNNVTSSSTPQENGNIKSDKTKAVKGKEIKLTKHVKPKITAQELYKSFLENCDDDSENEEEMDAISPSDESSDEDDEDVGEENSEDSTDSENDKDNLHDQDFVREFTCNMRDEPGSNSGCTAVVALLHGNELYVANAGDSRCIVCRNGKAIEMSFDHKPVNEEEYKRVVKAGGRVTADGRVNGGLNLSRAIGDHAYKQNKDLSNREQMIIALPDIQTLTIHPNEDEFMFLACDGIWNCMSNQEAVDFIRPAIHEGKKKMSQICEEMFDKCLNSVGDGDDNMTAIIVQFKTHILKRSAEESNCNKRLKTEENRDTGIV